jgi:hypothetical protein
MSKLSLHISLFFFCLYGSDGGGQMWVRIFSFSFKALSLELSEGDTEALESQCTQPDTDQWSLSLCPNPLPTATPLTDQK